MVITDVLVPFSALSALSGLILYLNTSSTGNKQLLHKSVYTYQDDFFLLSLTIVIPGRGTFDDYIY